METKAQLRKMEFLKYCMGFSGSFAVNCEGSCDGGLVMFREPKINLEILSYSKHHFDAWLYDETLQCKWHMSL